MDDPAMDRSEDFREAFKALVRVRATRRLAALGESTPDIEDIPRLRGNPAAT